MERLLVAAMTLIIPVSKHLLRYWDVENGCFVTPRGQYTIEIGASSSDIRATTTVTL